jgi:hypothetical protein
MRKLIIAAAAALALAGCAGSGGPVASDPYRPGSAAAACWAAGYSGEPMLDICDQPAAPAYHAGQAARLNRGPTVCNDGLAGGCPGDALIRAGIAQANPTNPYFNGGYVQPPSPPMVHTFSYHCQNAGYSNVCTVNPY